MRPENLFKFRPWPTEGVNHTQMLLEQSAFYCGSPKDFDDPHDCQLGAHATGSARDVSQWLAHDMAGIPGLLKKHKLHSLTQLKDCSVTDQKDSKTLTAIAGRKARRQSRVLCLSSDWSSELMWAFYASNHQGICLCFDGQHDFFCSTKPVLYSHTPAGEFYSIPHDGSTDQGAFCKSLSWQFQMEWRLIFPRDEPKLVSFPKNILKAIILGYRFPEICFDSLKTVLVKHGYQVKLLRAERIPDSFDLGLVEVDKS